MRLTLRISAAILAMHFTKFDSMYNSRKILSFTSFMTFERFTVGRAMPAASGGARPTKYEVPVFNYVIINNASDGVSR